MVLPAQEGGLWAICLEMARGTDWSYLRGIFTLVSLYPSCTVNFLGNPIITTSLHLLHPQFPFGEIRSLGFLWSDRRWRGGTLYVVPLGVSLVALL